MGSFFLWLRFVITADESETTPSTGEKLADCDDGDQSPGPVHSLDLTHPVDSLLVQGTGTISGGMPAPGERTRCDSVTDLHKLVDHLYVLRVNFFANISFMGRNCLGFDI